jgi:lycopene beta-cyclase
MSYFGFLARFLVIPIIIFALFYWWDERRGKVLPLQLRAFPPLRMLAILVGVALVYTTPWDNYLVATRVWWYDPELVTGVVLGWVPIEEYTFFVLQPILVGLWLLWLARRLPQPDQPDQPEVARNSQVRLVAVALIGCVWMGAITMLLAGWQPGTYLALELAWALPPIMLQLYFGADLLLRQWRLLALTIVPMTFYLSAADSIAITAGTWTIDPAQSLAVQLGGVLPVEELIFFLLTTVLVSFGLTLGIAAQSWRQLRALRLVNGRLVNG